MYFVYILSSLREEYFYKGLAHDLDKRLKEHFAGKVPSTKDRLPMELLHVELCSSRIEARKIEKFFKSGYGREVLEEIYSNHYMPTW